MSIKSRGPFGGVTLTDDDAKRLLRHMAEDKPSQAAKASLQRGRALLTDMEKNGQLLSPLSGRNDPNQQTEDATP